VFVEVPRDLVGQLVQPFSMHPARDPDRARDDDAAAIAAHVVEELGRARRPVMLVGERMRHHARARELVVELAETLRIPYATNAFAKGVLDETHPLSLGVYNGVFGNGEARAYLEREADYVLELFTSVVAQDTSTAFGTGTYDPARRSRHTVLRGSAADGSDVANVLEVVLEASVERFDPPPFRGMETNDELPADEPLGFHVLARALDECQRAAHVPFVYLPEIGNAYFASFGLRTRASSIGRSWITNPWYAAMGTSLPYAREVALTLRERDADDLPVVLIGDGGFHFQSSELARFQADRLGGVVVLLRNNLFHLGKMGDGPMYRSSAEDFDAAALARAYGATYRLAETAGDLREAFAAALDDRPRLYLFELPLPTTEATQSPEIRLLNLYIRARGGDPAARTAWEALVAGSPT
jgi:thiamine pyrophosphate-dependent acetolactate synthase large subunit-like protein